MFIKVLYTIFRRPILELYHKEQAQVRKFNMVRHFIDSKGKAYDRFQDDFEIPLARFHEIQKRIVLIKSGMSDDTMILFIQAMEKALDDGKKPKLSEIGHLILEMKKRIGIWVDTDLLYDIVALTYIREDEKPQVIDWTVHKEKIIQFKADSMEGLYGFFQHAGLTTYIPFVGTTPEEFDEYFKKSELKMKAITTYLSNYITE